MRETRDSGDDRSGAHGVELPEGVDLAEWSLERVRVQNPSIRSYLGCIRKVEEDLDSNYAILHCSPERLSRLWRRVHEVSHPIRSELIPTLEQPSVIPTLGEARLHALVSFRELSETVLAPMEEHGSSLRPDQHSQVRKLLCVSLGKIYAFLRDTFGEIVASDPRSRHDADYFLSRRFAQDIDESEWLYSSVYQLTDLVRGLERTCTVVLGELQSRMRVMSSRSPSSSRRSRKTTATKRSPATRANSTATTRSRCRIRRRSHCSTRRSDSASASAVGNYRETDRCVTSNP